MRSQVNWNWMAQHLRPDRLGARSRRRVAGRGDAAPILATAENFAWEAGKLVPGTDMKVHLSGRAIRLGSRTSPMAMAQAAAISARVIATWLVRFVKSNITASRRRVHTFIKLLCTAWSFDDYEGVAEVGWAAGLVDLEPRRPGPSRAHRARPPTAAASWP
jgi:hypothetical protein